MHWMIFLLGIYVEVVSQVLMVQLFDSVTITNNRGSIGGGLCLQSGDGVTSLKNCTINGNTAATAGAALFLNCNIY